MTKISMISGVGRLIPQNELRDRGRMVTPGQYIPFMSQTQGQTEVDIMRNLATSLAQWSGDPSWRKAATLLSNASVAGVHGYNKIMGPLSDAEMWAASVIQASKAHTNYSVLSNRGLSRIGDPIFPEIGTGTRVNRAFATKFGNVLKLAGYTDYVNKALSPQGYASWYWINEIIDDKKFNAVDRGRMEAYYLEQKSKFEGLKIVEAVYNEYLPQSSHHVLYFPIQEAFSMPERVFAKRLLHTSGVEGLSGSADLSPQVMRTWLGASIMSTNLQGGVGNLTPIQTAFGVANEQAGPLYAKYASQFPVKQIGAIGAFGVDDAIVLAIIGLVTAAINAASKMVTEVQKTKQLALTQAKGFGTPALSAATSDWTGGATPGGGSTGNSNTLLLLGAAAAGAYLLTQD